MKSAFFASSLFLSILLLSFFTVFAFHAQTPLQEDVKSYLETGSEELPFSQAANSHMRDVFVLLSFARILATFSIIVTLISLSSISQRVVRNVSILLASTVVVVALLPWNAVFTQFHKVFFPQGNWLFPANSLLIQTYPAEFFVMYAAVFGLLVLLVAGFLYLFSRMLPASLLHQEV